MLKWVYLIPRYPDAQADSLAAEDVITVIGSLTLLANSSFSWQIRVSATNDVTSRPGDQM
jgi:hypothetical protein